MGCRRRRPRRLYRSTGRGRAAYALLKSLADLASGADSAEAMRAVRLLSSGARLRLADVLREGGASTSRLAAASGVLPVNASAALDFMEAAGVVARVRSRRAVVNSLTERGGRFLEILDELAADRAEEAETGNAGPAS